MKIILLYICFLPVKFHYHMSLYYDKKFQNSSRAFEKASERFRARRAQIINI